MSQKHIHIEQSLGLRGQAPLHGAKNASLPILASLILTDGVSRLSNIPNSQDIIHMTHLLQRLGAQVAVVDEHTLEIDTSTINKYCVEPEIMKKMRASILAMGPLLARFGRADIALPGGCVIGARPVNYHLESFAKMGADIEMQGDFLYARTTRLKPTTIIMEYPSVGATENIMMAAVRTPGITRIVNAALEPEVLEVISVLRKMGAQIIIHPPATLEIEGVQHLNPIEHHIMYDRLEAGAIMVAAAITGGDVYLPHAPAYAMEIFVMKLEEMGHTVEVGAGGVGVRVKGSTSPRAVSFKTGPYPGFPTDLQAPMMAAQCVADGVSVVEETVFENRLLHIQELQKMGAAIKIISPNKVAITGVEELYGARVIATDIRASCALVIAGLVAKGSTSMTGIHHWQRGYDKLENTLVHLGAYVRLLDGEPTEQEVASSTITVVEKITRPLSE